MGQSLGINLLPVRGKICNFDCIYCECGWNADGRGDKVLPTASQVRSALEGKLTECMLNGTHIDSITFSGDGEPTLNPDFPDIINDTLMLRDTFYPSAKVSVLTNATRLGEKSVFNALRKVDNPILKLDAPTTELVRIINRCQPSYNVENVVEWMRRFEGDFVLQTMFLKSPDFDSLSAEMLSGWLGIVLDLHPRLVMAYTIDRPVPAIGLRAYSAEEISKALMPLSDAGINLQIRA